MWFTSQCIWEMLGKILNVQTEEFKLNFEKLNNYYYYYSENVKKLVYIYLIVK